MGLKKPRNSGMVTKMKFEGLTPQMLSLYNNLLIRKPTDIDLQNYPTAVWVQITLSGANINRQLLTVSGTLLKQQTIFTNPEGNSYSNYYHVEGDKIAITFGNRRIVYFDKYGNVINSFILNTTGTDIYVDKKYIMYKNSNTLYIYDNFGNLIKTLTMSSSNISNVFKLAENAYMLYQNNTSNSDYISILTIDNGVINIINSNSGLMYVSMLLSLSSRVRTEVY